MTKTTNRAKEEKDQLLERDTDYEETIHNPSKRQKAGFPPENHNGKAT